MLSMTICKLSVRVLEIKSRESLKVYMIKVLDASVDRCPQRRLAI